METPQTLSLIFEIITQLFMPILQNKRLRRLSSTLVIKAPHNNYQTQRCLLAANLTIEKARNGWNYTNSVTYCIAKNMLPMYNVAKPGFHRMLAEFDKWYEPPSRKYISKTTIPRAYNNTKKKVVSDLSHVE